jgi:hypothetical protein
MLGWLQWYNNKKSNINKPMPIFEKFRKAEQEDKAKAAQGAGEKKIEGPTIKQILADKEQSRLFGMHLEEQGNNELGAKILSGQLSPEEVSELSAERQNFLETMASVKAMRERLSSKNIEEIISSSPELQKIADSVGPQGVREAALRDLERLAIQDPDSFWRISGAIEDIELTETSIKEEDKKVSEICRKYKIGESEYLKAVRDKDNPNAVYDLVESRMGRFKKLFSKKETIDAEIDGVADRTADIKMLSAEYDGRISGIAEALRATIIGNKNVWDALVADLQGQSAERPEKEISFSEFMNTPMDRENIQSEWDTYKSAHEHDQGFSEEDAKVDFANEYLDKNVTKKRKGFWSIVGKTLWESFIKGNLK